MKKLILVIIPMLAFVAVSCKKNSEPPVPAADYFNLKVGNYWIYANYTSDSTGVFKPTGKFDSEYIEKDTMIRGFTYYKLLMRLLGTEPLFPEFLRDSSGYLVESRGYRLASDFNFTDVMEIDTTELIIFSAFLKMTGKDSVVTIPAGDFPSITSRETFIPSPPNPHSYPVRYGYDVYGKSVGRIKSHVFYWSGFGQIETRLVRYKTD
jgi:hypothetical protein